MSPPLSSGGHHHRHRQQSRQRKMLGQRQEKQQSTPEQPAAVSVRWCQHRLGADSRVPPLVISSGPVSTGPSPTQPVSPLSSSSVPPSRVPLTNSPDLQLRFLTPGDLPEVKRLCKEWFPIDYPDAWYNDITSSAKFFSVACVLHGRIIGLVVAEIRDFGKLPKEDSELLAATFGPSTKVAYVLSLGVVRELRNNGVASLLLGNLISHLTSDGGGGYEDSAVRAVYLHVLTTNSQAISFYENRGFSPHLFLPYYYNIKGRRRDGFTYVRYLNGGHPPWGLLEYAAHWCRVAATLAMNPWAGARKVVGGLAWQGLVPRVRQIAQSSTAMFS